MRDRVLSYIREHGLIKPGDRVAAAVSGGADSVVLLRIMLDLRNELGFVLSVVHFNHKIRAEADDDERFVQALANQHQLNFHRAEADVPAYARQHKISLETAARKLRYDFFRTLLGTEVNKIATAHTLNDQAETVLMRAIRGAGTKGLAGIYPVQNLAAGHTTAVVRPMLCLERNEIEQWLGELNQGWRQDATNLDPHHLRNRVRHHLLPVLERDFNPGILDVLSDLAEVARGDEAYFAELVANSPALEPGAERPRLRIPVLTTLPLAIQRRLVRHCGERLGIALEFAHVEQVLRLARSEDGSGECELPDGWVAVRERAQLCFDRREQTSAVPMVYEYPLPIPGEVVVHEIGTVIKAFLRAEIPENSGYNRNQLLDPVSLGAGLVVRNWRPGDRFWPAHTKAPKKVKELLQKQHIAARERALWPVVSCGETLIWVRGFAGAATLLPGDGSKQLVIEETLQLSGRP